MSKTEQLKEYVQSLDGYRISNTHFKISKVHSSDFFYAKRLFQNSYYTARIALVLAIKIKDILISNGINSLTLVGYELYSELLLSLIKKFLNDYGYSQINHFVSADLDEEIKYFPPFINPYENALIIVPIASTGTTAIKIEEFVKILYPQTKCIHPHYNIILATDESSDFLDIINQTENQQSFIRLNAEWQNPSDCKWCFDNHNSRPLFETDKSSLTPTLIFDKPSAKRNFKNSLSWDFDKITFNNALIYRKAKRNNEHFLFSTKTDILIEKNKPTINKWLDIIKKELKVFPNDKVVIISPCHYSNTTFINLVNDKIFHSSATIIHHQTDVDYLSNFRLLNYNYLNQKDAKIFFVDDSLISGGTFFRIYDLLRYTLNYEKELSGAILLSDKSSPDIETRVLRAAKKIYSFIKVNLPMHPKVSGKRPLEHEIKKYDDLSQMVLHDLLKKIFYVKSLKVGGEEFSEEIISENKEPASGEERVISTAEKDSRHLKMFKATHKIYEFFQNTNDIQNISFNDLIIGCGFDEKDVENKMALMKVLSQYPFLLYKPVRDITFKWHKEWFDEEFKVLSKQLDSHIGTYIFTYNKFCELKFLIRRSVFLLNNRILQHDFFNLISKVFEKVNTPEIIKKEVAIENHSSNFHTDLFIAKKPSQLNKQIALVFTEKKNVEDFHIFLLLQYLEMVQKNRWCAVKIIESIKKTESNFKTLKGKQFIRMLKIEVANVLNDFYSILQQEKDWKELYKFQTAKNGKEVKVKKIEPDKNNKKIFNYLNTNDKFLKTNEAEIAFQTLGLTKTVLGNQILDYLWTKQFLRSEKHAKDLDINLTTKTDAIFDKLINIFDKKNDVGAFFIVTDGKDNPHLVYDKDSEGNKFIGELDILKHGVLYSFLDGQKTAYGGDKTIIEYEKVSDNKWKDLYALENDSQKEFSADCNWLLLIRISDKPGEIKKNKKKEITPIKYNTLGLMGFYSKENLQNDLFAKQLFMLIRKDVGEFIKRHHKNNSFFELLENRAIINYQRHLKHGIGNFISYQKQIIQQFENIEDKVKIDEKTTNVKFELDKEYIKLGSFDFKEFNVITNSIKSQIGVSTKKSSSQEIFFHDNFIDLISTIYKSEKIGEKIGSLDFKTEVTLLNNTPFKNIRLPIALIDSIIPEIIINQKKYGINRTINWEENDFVLKLVFSNNIKPNAYDEIEGYGLKMCIEIRELYKNNITITLPEKPYKNEFTVSIEISKT